MLNEKIDVIETEKAIKFIKDSFEAKLAEKLDLVRVSAPLFVRPETGLNDNLNGSERTVSFDASGMNVEVVQSLAKWKRMALAKYHFSLHKGLYTDMNAIRRDEKLDELHSIYVDQWDWEKIIAKDERNLDYLFLTVKKIYEVIVNLATDMSVKYGYKYDLPETITFISTTELEKKYPNLTRKERENALLGDCKSAFVYQIGWPLLDGMAHDGRAADYDDWQLNGDILLWHSNLEMAFEVSSMGIRVDEESLPKQLEYKQELAKLSNPYCQAILNKELPYTIGGGIGQSRLCMYFLQKKHIGEVQASIWPEEMVLELKTKGIELL